MKSWRFWLVACAALLAVSGAHAQEFAKVGYVNTERILRDAAPAKAAQQKLELEFSKRDKELQELAARLRSMSERLERDAAVMNDSERGRRQR